MFRIRGIFYNAYQLRAQNFLSSLCEGRLFFFLNKNQAKNLFPNLNENRENCKSVDILSMQGRALKCKDLTLLVHCQEFSASSSVSVLRT